MPTEMPVPEDEISLSDMVNSLWGGRWLLVICTLALGAAAFVASQVLPKTYRAQVILSPVTSSPGSERGALGAFASQLGGLASLAGLDGADSKRWESIAVLESQGLTRQFIEQNDLLPVLFPKKWDAATGQWRTPPESTPDLWDGTRYIENKVRNLATDSKTGLVTLTISWRDPQQAADWANELVKLTNTTLRARAIAESERNIAYLSEQANRTEEVDLKQAIYDLLKSEINKMMLARGSDEFAFRVLDAAIPPRRPSSPLPLLWTLAGAFGGAFIAVLVIFTRTALRR